MLCLLPLLSFIITYSSAQVAPNYEPYSLINPEYILTSKELTIGVDNIDLNFIENAQMTFLPDGIVYRLSISFRNLKSGHLSISSWKIPSKAMLFIFNDEQSYTGPYLSKSDNEFISGRFISKKLTLEYFEPVNAQYYGDFIIDRIIPDYVIPPTSSSDIRTMKTSPNRENHKIMVTGYWPPTNEMVRHFSQDSELNPAGWQGENWEGLGYDVVSFFPQFKPADCNNCGQGYGDLEVDYQDYSEDFWPIIEEVEPVGIITFSRGFNDMSWEIENRLVNRTNWHDDYTPPLLPTPNPPDDTMGNYHVRYTSLPVTDIINAIQVAHIGLDPYLDNTNAGMFLSEFSGYHGVWYKETYDEDVDIPCFSGGHIHVGAQVDWDIAKEATEISIRTLINYIDQFIVMPGDCNDDEEVNILDVVALAGAILGNLELTPSQTQAADMDENGILNVLDIIAIINLILT